MNRLIFRHQIIGLLSMFAVLLAMQMFTSIVSAQGFDQIASTYSQDPSFSFKDDFAPPVNGANYVASPSWQPFDLPQQSDYVLADSKFVIPPGISKIVMVIHNSIYDSPSTPSGQCNMLSFKTGSPDASLDVSSNAIGILLQQDKSAFWAGQKSLRYGWNSDRTTFTLTMPDKDSPDYNAIKDTGLWCYMKTASCAQQMFSYNIQMIIGDLEKYKAWYDLMSVNDQGWDFAGNPASDLSVLSNSNPTPIDPNPLTPGTLVMPESGMVNEDVEFVFGISGGVSTYTYTWDFGEDTVYDTPATWKLEDSQSHVYTAPGGYDVTVRVSDSNSQTLNYTYSITILDTTDLPDPPITPDPELNYDIQQSIYSKLTYNVYFDEELLNAFNDQNSAMDRSIAYEATCGSSFKLYYPPGPQSVAVEFSFNPSSGCMENYTVEYWSQNLTSTARTYEGTGSAQMFSTGIVRLYATNPDALVGTWINFKINPCDNSCAGTTYVKHMYNDMNLEQYTQWYNYITENNLWQSNGDPPIDSSDPILPNCTFPPDKLNVIDQANATTEAPVVFENNTFTLNTPSYCDPVDIYFAIFTSTGKLIFVDSANNLTLDFDPYAAGSTSAINTSFSVADSSLASDITGECVLYWLIAPANGGDIVRSLNGAFDLGFYGFEGPANQGVEDFTITSVEGDSYIPFAPITIYLSKEGMTDIDPEDSYVTFNEVEVSIHSIDNDTRVVETFIPNASGSVAIRVFNGNVFTENEETILVNRVIFSDSKQ